jgi:hypothetical protein
MEYQDAKGTPIQLTEDRLTYGHESITVDEMGGVQSAPSPWYGTATFELRVIRADGTDLVINDLTQHTADQLRQRITSMRGERRQ